jgi:hypothetical protein
MEILRACFNIKIQGLAEWFTPHHPSKHEALSSSPSTAKKKEEVVEHLLSIYEALVQSPVPK